MPCLLHSRPSMIAGLLLLYSLTTLAADAPPIDWERARDLMLRRRTAETLSAEDEAYLARARSARQTPGRNPDGRAQRPAAAGSQSLEQAASLRPLTELSAQDSYKGVPGGGLYGDGRNTPPPAHLEAALQRALDVRPRDADGRPAPNGKVAMISVGMSNTTQEFSRFMALAATTAARSPHLVIVDGAQGGQDAAAWVSPDRGRPRQTAATPWTVLERRLTQANVSPLQVQVAWIKQALRNPAGLGEFPKHAKVLEDDLAVIVTKLRERFPNLQLVYLSSRIYAGWAGSGLNPEPYAYEGAFAVRRLIERQMAGEARLDYRPGAERAPLLLWGPYLWAGAQPRAGDGLFYERADFAADGTHPSDAGRRKVAEQLLRFFTTDPTAIPWFVKTATPD